MKTNSKNYFIKVLLGLITLGVWINVLHGIGIIPVTHNVRTVNTVDVEGYVEVTGDVNVDNTVDINLEEILGYKVGCREAYVMNGTKHVSLDVSNPTFWFND